MDHPFDLTIIGGGLAGCEAALQAAKHGLKVKLFEMRPSVMTGAHISDKLAELVCSNSFGSNLSDRASGLFKSELRRMSSFLIKIADETSLPAGRALAVDRTAFADRVSNLIDSFNNIVVFREEVRKIPQGPLIIASGPLTSEPLANAISELIKTSNLFFYDAIAPIVAFNSINHNIAFKASRYQAAESIEGDYVNLPFSEKQYYQFVDLLKTAKRNKQKPFEKKIDKGVIAGSAEYFEGCLPVEVLANRGVDALAFGPMRPVGLIDPRTNKRPYAVVQLRQDSLSGDLYNMVGFQTNLVFDEQLRVFRSIPGLQDAEFIRLGQMHRNTYIASPKLLDPTLKLRNNPDVFFAGQITGIEGYVGSIGTGLLAGWNAVRMVNGLNLLEVPATCMFGALCNYISRSEISSFQPMKANFGILPKLEENPKLGKRERYIKYAERSTRDLEDFIQQTMK